MSQVVRSGVSTAIVRKASITDVPAMIKIARATPTASQWSEAQYFELFAPNSPNRLALVIEQESSLLGFLVARCSREEYEIENIAVSAAQQRQGLGTKLLKEFMRIVGEILPTKVFVEVRESNMVACALYSKLGFKQIGERKNYYRDPEESALLYQIVIA